MSQDPNECFIITRRGKMEPLDIQKIFERIQTLVKTYMPKDKININYLVLEVTKGVVSGMTTSEIDKYTANVCASCSIMDPQYLKLAGIVAVADHHKNTSRSFVDKMIKIYNHAKASKLSKEFITYVEKHQDEIDKMIDYQRDFLIDFFGMKTFEKQYSLKLEEKVWTKDNNTNKNSHGGSFKDVTVSIERPQDMFMRTAIALNMNAPNASEKQQLEYIKETYDLLSLKYYTHASPTYFNAGCERCQYASCFLMGNGDSLEELEGTRTNAAKISKSGGGIGICVSPIRSEGAYIHSTGGKACGIIPVARGIQETMIMYNQGGRRPGSAKLYLSMTHPDLLKFIEMKRISLDPADRNRARELFYALWVPDLFMKRVKSEGKWSLFDPSEVGDLSEYWGEEFEKRYLQLEEQKLYKSQYDARHIWNLIYEVNQETGGPDLLSADNANRANMQANFGVLKNSNLCNEIFQYSRTEEYGVCILSSLSLPTFVIDAEDIDHEFPHTPVFDFEKLIKVTRVVCRNLNLLIDKTFHPVEEARRGCERQRAIGIGVQGLDDTYAKFKFAFDSEEAKKLNREIFETIYYAAVTESCEQARQKYLQLKEKDPNTPQYAGAYPMFVGSPWHQGKLHFDFFPETKLSGKFDWESLRQKIAKFGVRNSLLTALMPTASTSQLLGNNECFEPYTSNIYKRDTQSGEFIVIKKYLIRELFDLGVWNSQLKDYLILAKGSVQFIEGLPASIKRRYKTVWEIDQSVLVQQAIERQPFIDQGQSMNLFVRRCTLSIFTKLMFQAHRGGLPTMKYYLRTEPAQDPISFSIDPEKESQMKELIEKNNRAIHETKIQVKELENYCESCSG